MSTGVRAIGPGLDDIEQELDGMVELNRYLSPAAESVDAHLGSTIAAGTTPSGDAWALKEDGTKALRNAKKAVSVRHVGNTVVIELKGHEVFHHYKSGHNLERTVIPKELDEKLGNAIRRGVVTGWNRELK